MKPYYEHAGITIYHGDCLQVMAEMDEKFAAIVTDPPYASGARTEAAKASSGAMVRGQRWAQKPIDNDQMTTTGFVWLVREVLLSASRMLAEGGSVLSFIESCNLRVNGMIVWDKTSYGLGHGFRAQHELILHASKGVADIANHDTGNVLSGSDVIIMQGKRVTDVDHPSPKPIGLMEQLLRVVASPGDAILDPFVGAGSALLAAKNLGMKAIGIDTEERHCETAAQRLNQGVLFHG